MVTMIRSDLDFILAQIKIAEADARHDADPVNNPDVFGTLLPNSEVPWGLRRVDGSNNNLIPEFSQYGAAGEAFPARDTARLHAGYWWAARVRIAIFFITWCSVVRSWLQWRRDRRATRLFAAEHRRQQYVRPGRHGSCSELAVEHAVWRAGGE
jgi:hypothetical protein